MACFGARRALLAAVCLTLALASASGAVGGTGHASPSAPSAQPVRTDAKPNVVMVMADDMRVDDLDFAPRIRRLVGRNGLTFENSFSPYPLCCPARASFLTGQYAHNHGVLHVGRPYGYRSFDDSRTLATSLSDAGYRTGFVGKYLNGYGPDRSRVSGKPSYRYVPRGWDQWRASFTNPGIRGIHGGTYNYFDSPYNANGRVDNRYRGQYQTDVVGRFSQDLARRFQGRSPFFLYVSFVAPHFGGGREPDDPRRVRNRDGQWHRFETPARPRWVRGRFDDVVTRGSGMPRGGGPAERDVDDKPYFFATKPELNRAERRALTTVTRQRAEAVYVMDRAVGRLVRTLKQTGEWDETVLMFTSDNGYFLGEHRQATGKIKAHEPSLRVPFLVTGPGLRTGERRYDPISTVDVAATVLDIAGARPPRPPDGTSRWPTMIEGDQGWTVPVVTESIGGRGTTRDGFAPLRQDPRTSIGLRTARYSYSRHRNGQSELYDLLTDPAQLRNVHGDGDYVGVRRALRRAWASYQDCSHEACRVPLPESLAAPAPQVREWTRAYWDEIDRRYGRR